MGETVLTEVAPLFQFMSQEIRLSSPRGSNLIFALKKPSNFVVA